MRITPFIPFNPEGTSEITNLSVSPPKIDVSSTGKTAPQAAVQNSRGARPAPVASVTGNAIGEQSAKHFGTGGKVRFTMSLGSKFTFQAHLDPNDITKQQNKRVAQMDVFGGVVVQDFGFKATILEVKGTTGSKYYEAINLMNDIFNHQSLGAPTKVDVTLDGYSYQAVLQQFNYGRQINQGAGNLVNYQMSFIILGESQVAAGSGDTVAAGSSAVQKLKASKSQQTTSGGSSQKIISWTGSINDYINQKLTGAPRQNSSAVKQYLKDHWDATANNGPYPNENKPLGKNCTLVTTDWKTLKG